MPAAAPLLALLLSALPPAPEKVVLQTRSFGTVTVDHAAHLKRRARCASCHGPGPVTKIGRFEPKEAHDRCIGCHKQVAKGPTGCRQCHVVPEGPVQAVQSAAASPPGGPSPPGVAAPAPGAAPPAVAVGAGAVAAGPALARSSVPLGTSALTPPPGPPLGAVPEAPFLGPRALLLEVGASTITSSRRSQAVGVAARVTLREDGLLIRESVEWCGGQQGRTLGMLGVGWSFPVARAWSLEALAVGGFDAVNGQPVYVLPAAGVQVGVVWSARLGFVDEIGLSVSGTSDLVRRRTAIGEPVGGFGLSTTLTLGMAKSQGP